MKYYLNADVQLSGDYEVHNEECSAIDLDKKKYKYLGEFLNCHRAIMAANQMLKVNCLPERADGCAICCSDCDGDKAR